MQGSPPCAQEEYTRLVGLPRGTRQHGGLPTWGGEGVGTCAQQENKEQRFVCDGVFQFVSCFWLWATCSAFCTAAVHQLQQCLGLQPAASAPSCMRCWPWCACPCTWDINAALHVSCLPLSPPRGRQLPFAAPSTRLRQQASRRHESISCMNYAYLEFFLPAGRAPSRNVLAAPAVHCNKRLDQGWVHAQQHNLLAAIAKWKGTYLIYPGVTHSTTTVTRPNRQL